MGFDELEIGWPSGEADRRQNIKANQGLVIEGKIQRK
jgi:hypothetical protein